QEQVAFSKYAAWVANRFKDLNVIYEIWNEWPYLEDERLGPPFSKESAIAYVELVKNASLAIHDAVPNAYIIAGSYNPLNDRFDGWSEEIIKAGIFNYINALSVHP
ncbi:TPA: cellulase family glycosylhydrolase, partial [Klebsiella pneumoniae]|nr:cellulase family glycosylhydrolase [Klebsiella pneumoniae]